MRVLAWLWIVLEKWEYVLKTDYHAMSKEIERVVKATE